MTETEARIDEQPEQIPLYPEDEHTFSGLMEGTNYCNRG